MTRKLSENDRSGHPFYQNTFPELSLLFMNDSEYSRITKMAILLVFIDLRKHD